MPLAESREGAATGTSQKTCLDKDSHPRVSGRDRTAASSYDFSVQSISPSGVRCIRLKNGKLYDPESLFFNGSPPPGAARILQQGRRNHGRRTQTRHHAGQSRRHLSGEGRQIGDDRPDGRECRRRRLRMDSRRRTGRLRTDFHVRGPGSGHLFPRLPRRNPERQSRRGAAHRGEPAAAPGDLVPRRRRPGDGGGSRTRNRHRPHDRQRRRSDFRMDARR